MTTTHLTGKTKDLFDYSIRICNEKRLKDIRKFGDNFSIDLIHEWIDTTKYKIVSVEKTNTVGYYMNWHLDDAKIIEHKKGVNHSIFGNQEFISETRSIYYKNDRPEYSLIVYDSNYGDDFTGGVLEFFDGTKIYPKKGSYVFFSSDELHRVSRILSGTRNNTLIKFYLL